MKEGMTPEDLEGATFSTRLRGYDPEEVGEFLKDAADELRRAQAVRSERLYEVLGEEMGGLLQRARDSADEMVRHAEVDALRMRDEAAEGATSVREESEEAAARTIEEAGRAAAETRARAEADAAQRVQEASDRVGELEERESDVRSRLAGLRAELEGLTDRLRSLESFQGTPAEKETSTEDKGEIRLEAGAESTTG
jgi:cell division initiation protein